MPPATFIAASAPTFPIDPVTGATDISFLVPSTTQPGDSLLLVAAGVNSSLADIDVARLPAGWSVIGRFVTAGSQIFNILRRVATDKEPPSYSIATLASGAMVGGALLVYRGLDTNAALITGQAFDFVGSTNFVCGNLTLTSYSDLYLGVVFVTSASVAVTPPAGTTERFEAAQAPFGATELEVFEFLQEVTGVTGAKTATTAAVQSGLTAAVLLKAKPTLLAPSITPDVPGAIGFVTVGV